MARPGGRDWAGLQRRYGNAGGDLAWRAVLEAYYADELESAFAGALSLGAGERGVGVDLYRMVEAEARSREISERSAGLGDWWELESPGRWEEDFREGVRALVAEETSEVFGRLGYEPKERVLYSFLVDEVDTRWTGYRHGYMVDKTPYDKVCLPERLARREGELREAVRHETAHVVTLNMSGGRVPTWLDEAVAMWLDGRLDPAFVEAVEAGEEDAWVDVWELEEDFEADRRTREGQDAVWWAYQQSAALGRFLGRDGGEKLRLLLVALGGMGVWEELWQRLVRRDGVDGALRKVYGMGEEELFARAREWVAGGMRG